MTTQETLTLIIKGNRFQAAHAAADRGIPLVFCRENANETAGETAATFEDLARLWFCEAPHTPPFPPGTLLFWTSTKGETP